MFSLLRERRREASIPTEEEEEEEERTELTIGEERGSSSSTEERGNFKPAGLLVERRETGVPSLGETYHTVFISYSLVASRMSDS